MKRANLCHITFTGIDERTDIHALREIQREFPIAEFGVLMSYNWKENGNRFLNPKLIRGLRSELNDRRLNLSLHVCGSAAHDAAIGDWYRVDRPMRYNIDIFQRCQLNIAGRIDNPIYARLPMIIGQEVIIQQKDVYHCELYAETLKHWFPYPNFFSVLLDASGGRGVDTPIEVISDPLFKVGYAGGFNPDNVADKLSYLLEHDTYDFWIDMETGVRTDDWFDLNKVVKVLQICKQVLDYHKKGGLK